MGKTFKSNDYRTQKYSKYIPKKHLEKKFKHKPHHNNPSEPNSPPIIDSDNNGNDQ